MNNPTPNNQNSQPQQRPPFGQRPAGPSRFGQRPGGPGRFGPRPAGQGQGQGGRFGQRQGGARTPGRGPRRTDPRFEKKDDFKDKVLDLRRVTRVVAGGKRFRFRATVVVGDEKGKIGVGVAKGLDVQSTVQKARQEGKKNLVSLALKDGRTIAHEVIAKYSAAKVVIKPAKTGAGLKAGGAPRVVLALAGIKDASAKCLGRTPNKLTNALATIEALRALKSEPVKK